MGSARKIGTDREPRLVVISYSHRHNQRAAQYCVVPDIPGLTSSCFLSVLVLVPRAFRFARDDFAFQSLNPAHEWSMAHPRGARGGVPRR